MGGGGKKTRGERQVRRERWGFEQMVSMFGFVANSEQGLSDVVSSIVIASLSKVCDWSKGWSRVIAR